MNTQVLLLAGLLCLFSITHEIASFRLLTAMDASLCRHPMQQFLSGTAVVLWTLFAGWFPIPVPILFVILFLIIFYKIIPVRGLTTDTLISGLIGFLSFVSLLLMLLGLTAVIGTDVMGVLASRSLRLLILTCAQFLGSAFCLLPVKELFHNREQIFPDMKRRRLLLAFLCFCVLYVFGDALLCSIKAPGNFIPLLLLTGNLLLLLLLIVVFYNNYMLDKNQYLEEEHSRIEAERARKLYRTSYLRQLSQKDQLTGAYSRGYILEQLKKWQSEGQTFSLIYIDLDNLKQINDRQGHDAGDRYLITFSRGMTRAIGSDGMLARIGGDEFLVVFPKLPADDGYQRIAEIRRRMEQPEPPDPSIRFSFGAVSGTEEIETLIRHADHEMYLDKQKRKECADHVAVL